MAQTLTTYQACIEIGKRRGWTRPISREGLRRLAQRRGVTPAVPGRAGVSAEWNAADIRKLCGKGKP